MDLDVLRGDATHKIYGIFFSMVGVLGSPNTLVEHDILKISYRYQHVYVLTYISKISTGYL